MSGYYSTQSENYRNVEKFAQNSGKLKLAQHFLLF